MTHKHNKLFDRADEKQREYLYGALDYHVKENSSDATIILRLLDLYDSSCWFSVLSEAENYIYGRK